MFKKFAIAVLTAAVATSAYASCRYYSYTVNGKTINCTECCYGTGATRTCNVTCN